MQIKKGRITEKELKYLSGSLLTPDEVRDRVVKLKTESPSLSTEKATKIAKMGVTVVPNIMAKGITFDPEGNPHWNQPSDARELVKLNGHTLTRGAE